MEIQCCALLLLPAATDRYQITHNRSLQANCSSSTVIVLLYLSHSIPFFSFPLLLLSSLSISQAKMDNSSSRRICFTYFAFILRKKANGQKMGGFPSPPHHPFFHMPSLFLPVGQMALTAYSKPSSKLYKKMRFLWDQSFFSTFYDKV